MMDINQQLAVYMQGYSSLEMTAYIAGELDHYCLNVILIFCPQKDGYSIHLLPKSRFIVSNRGQIGCPWFQFVLNPTMQNVQNSLHGIQKNSQLPNTK